MQANGQFSVVVVGVMNPAIHRPEWYVENGIISNAELEATRVQPFVFVPPLSQFRFSETVVTCEPTRWQVEGEGEQSISRLVSIASQTFGCLPHTPVTALGVNITVSHETTVEPGPRIAALVESLPFGFPSDGKNAALRHISMGAGRTESLFIQTGPSDRTVMVGINIEFTIDSGLSAEVIRLKGDQHFSQGLRQCQSVLSSVLKFVENSNAS